MSNVIISESRLKTMTIYELRVYLKRLGGTPLNKSSAKLIEEIQEIQNGKVPLKGSNRGRKPKFIAQENEDLPQDLQMSKNFRLTAMKKKPFLQAFAELEKPEYFGRTAPSFANGVSAPVSATVCASETEVDTVSIADGVLVDEYEIPYIVNYDARYKYPVFLVEKNMIKAYALKTGDRVTGYAHGKNGKNYTVYEAEKINDVPRDDFVRGTAFEFLQGAYPEELFRLDLYNDAACRSIDLFAPLGKGARAAIIESPRRKSMEIMEAMAKELEQQSHVIYIPLGAMPEIISDAVKNLKKTEIAASDFLADCGSDVSRIYVYVERAKRLVEQGEDVVVMIHSLDRAFESLKRYYNSEETALEEIERLLCCAKNINGGGSLTFVYAVTKYAPDSIIALTERVCNCVVRLNDELKFSVIDGVDVFAGGTSKAKALRGADKYCSIEELRNHIFIKNAPSVLNALFKENKTNAELIGNLDKAISFVDEK